MEDTKPVCDDCGTPMHEFSAEEGKYWVAGWFCDDCGWSFDTHRSLLPGKKE